MPTTDPHIVAAVLDALIERLVAKRALTKADEIDIARRASEMMREEREERQGAAA